MLQFEFYCRFLTKPFIHTQYNLYCCLDTIIVTVVHLIAYVPLFCTQFYSLFLFYFLAVNKGNSFFGSIWAWGNDGKKRLKELHKKIDNSFWHNKCQVTVSIVTCQCKAIQNVLCHSYDRTFWEYTCTCPQALIVLKYLYLWYWKRKCSVSIVAVVHRINSKYSSS